MNLLDCNLQVYEKNSFTHPPSCILPSFSQNASRLLLLKRLWKYASTIFFRKFKQKVLLVLVQVFVLLVICVLNYDSHNPANIYSFKINNRNTRQRCAICSKLAIKTSSQQEAVFAILLFFVQPPQKFQGLAKISSVQSLSLFLMTMVK